MRPESILGLVESHRVDPKRRMTILSAAGAYGPDLGHIKRTKCESQDARGDLLAIEEAAERDEPDYGLAEVNTGVYCFDGPWLSQRIGAVPKSATGERYLTALAAIAVDASERVEAAPIALPDEAMGVNDREQLAAVGAVMRDRINRYWMSAGVTLVDPATTYIDLDVQIGQDSVIQPNSMLTGGAAIAKSAKSDRTRASGILRSAIVVGSWRPRSRNRASMMTWKSVLTVTCDQGRGLKPVCIWGITWR